MDMNRFPLCVSPRWLGIESSRGGAAVGLTRKPRVHGPGEDAGEGGGLLQRRGQQGSDRGGETAGHPTRGRDREERQGQEDRRVGKVIGPEFLFTDSALFCFCSVLLYEQQMSIGIICIKLFPINN